MPFHTSPITPEDGMRRARATAPASGPRAHIAPLLLLTLLLAIFLAASPSTTAWPSWDEETWPNADAWTTYGGNAAHTGRSPDTGPAKAQVATAAFNLGASSFTAPVFDEQGYVYLGTDAGDVWKLTPDLQVVWSSDVGGPLRASLLVIPEHGLVVAAPVAEELQVLDLRTGNKTASVKTDNVAPQNEYVITSAPVHHPNGLVIVGSMDGHVYAFHPTNGTQAWRLKVDPPIADSGTDKVVSSPAIGPDGTIYVGSQNNRLYALDPSGQKRWSVATRDLAEDSTNPLDKDEQITGSAAVDEDGTIYVGTSLRRLQNGAVYAFEDQGDSAKRLWSRAHNDKISTPVTIGADAVYVGAQGGSVLAFDKSDGNVRWSYEPGNNVRSASGNPVIMAVAEQAALDAAGRLYVPYWHVDLSKGFPPQDSGRSPLVALDVEDGSLAWFHVFDKAPRAPALLPVVLDEATEAARGSDALLYVVTGGGRVHAFGTTEPPAPLGPEPELSDDEGTDGGSDGNGEDQGTDGSADDTNEDTNEDTNGSTDDTRSQPGPSAALLLAAVLFVFILARRGAR